MRPAEGWRPNRVYRVELLPGVTDLRHNRSNEGSGAHLHHRRPPAPARRSRACRRLEHRPPGAPMALVVALLLPDSLPYRGVADSSGTSRSGPLPAGTTCCRGVLDENQNFPAGPREAFDSTPVRARQVGRGRALGLRARHYRARGSVPSRRRTAPSATIDFTQSSIRGSGSHSDAVAAPPLPDSARSPSSRCCPSRWTTASTAGRLPRIPPA